MAGYKYYQHGLIYSGAPHTERKLNKSECDDLLKKNPSAWFVRNVYDFDCDEQTSFWFVVQDSRCQWRACTLNAGTRCVEH